MSFMVRALLFFKVEWVSVYISYAFFLRCFAKSVIKIWLFKIKCLPLHSHLRNNKCACACSSVGRASDS